MRKISIFCGLCLVGWLSGTAIAADYPCLDNTMRETSQSQNPQPDPRSSLTWDQLGKAASAEVMQNMQGVWYSQTTDPNSGTVQHLYYSFEQGGLFRYRDQTCGVGAAVCSEGEGAGEYRASQQGDGSMFYMIRFSDLVRISQCRSSQFEFAGPQAMVTTAGGRWQRVP